MNDDTMTTDSSNALPDDFLPGEHDVVIGKGKKFYSHAGNVWLRSVVAGRIQEYSSAPNKADKSSIISSLVDYIRDHGRFVKQDVKSGGKWVHAEDLLCREKCGQAFRDNLAETYRSSSARKGNKRVGSSSDLINALRKTTLSSKESRDNLRHANSMGNFLRPNRSSGQFSAARKASFNKLNAASAAHNTKGGTMANATWAPSRNFNRGATSSNKILAQLRANHMPGLGGGTNLQQPQFHHQQQQSQLQQSQLQANLQQQQAQHGLMSGSLQNSNRILAQLQANAELQRQVQMNAQLLNGANHNHNNHNHAALLQPTPLAPGSQPGLRSGSPQDGLAAQQLPSLEPTPIREASHHPADHHHPPPQQPKSPIMADAQVSKLKQLQEQLQLDWEASTKNPSNVVGVVPEPPPVSILAEDQQHPNDGNGHMDDLLSMPIMELQSEDVVDPNSVEFSAEFELPGLSPEDEFAILE